MIKLQLSPDWSLFQKRPTWGYISTPELAKVLGVSLQSINNWVLRQKLPPPAPEGNPNFRGNKNFWQIASLRSYFERRAEDEIHWEWIKRNLPDDNSKTIGQAQFLVKHCYSLLGVEKA